MPAWLSLKRATESSLPLCDQHFDHLSQLFFLSCWFHSYSDCADDDGCQANASWASIASVHAHWAHLRDLWETLLCPPYSIPGSICCLLASFQRSEANIVGGNQFTLLLSVSWQTGKKKKKQKAAENSSSPYLLFRTQHKSHGKRKPIFLVENKETSATIIYMRFGRIKSIIFLRMPCYADLLPVMLSHSLRVQLASGVSSLPQSYW